jgi:glycosyltransferase involved in cell wall biosynthesis
VSPRNSERIALVNPGPPGTCGGVIAVELRNRLADHYHVEHLFVEEKGICEQSDWRGEPVMAVPFTMKKVRHWQVHRRMPEFDLYHYQSQRNLGLVRHGRKPGVLTCHGLAPLKAEDVYSRGTQRRFREQFKYLNEIDVVIANSQDTARDLTGLLDVPPEKIEVVYFGVNHGVFKPRDRTEARSSLEMPSESTVVLNVGTERKNKNIDRLLSVFSSLAAQVDNLCLVRLGDKDESFTKLLDKMGVANRVIRPGRIASPAPYYNAADVYLCMDLHASFGMPNLEAMASGCPVVTSNVEAIPEIVADACMLADPRNVEETAAAVRQVLESEDVRGDLRRRGLERARQFTWEKCAEETASVYSVVLRKG